MRARCPASSANLGPGFDALALALSLYVEVDVSPSEELSILSAGEGAEYATDANHLAARVVRDVCGHDRVTIKIHSEIPVGRGLGSSAALAAATAAACGDPDPLAVAARFDGHPENAAASVLGGLVAATIVGGAPVAERLPLDQELAFVLLVPDRELSTATARAVLASSVSLDDAVSNLGRMGLLIAGLADRFRLHAAAGEDRLHQPVRAGMFPEADGLMLSLREAGATVTCWSGAGPSLLAICTSLPTAAHVRDRGETALDKSGIAGTALLVEADLGGLVSEES